MADEELRDWQDLIESPGWGRLVDHVAAEWGRDEGNGAAFRQAVRHVADQPNDAAMAAQLRQVLAAQKAIHKMLRIPEEQIAALKRQQAYAAGGAEHLGRRGAL